MNVVVIVIDTLRYDHIGAHGSAWIETPNLDRLAAESWVFDNAFAASFPTIPHRTDAMTGRYGGPFHHWQPLSFDAVTLPWTLGEAGYATQLLHDTPHLVNGGHNFDWPFHAWTQIRGAEVDRPWVTDRLDWPDNWAADRLFDFREAPGWQRPGLASYLRANRHRREAEDWNAARLFRAGAEFLRDNAWRENFLLWLDCFDPHEPWDAPPEFVLKYDKTPGYDGRVDPRSFGLPRAADIPEAAARRVRAFYAAKVSWVDRWLGHFLEELERTELAKRTAIVLTSDHGTSLGERGQFHKRYPVREGEGHVPMFVRVPGGGSGRCAAIVQPQDIFATVAGIAGADVPEGPESFDMLATARGEREAPRRIALAGRPANEWNHQDGRGLFSAFDGRWCLEVALKPAHSALRRMGEAEEIAADNAAVVARLHAAALDELERRGCDPAVMAWLRSEGAEPFPADCRFHDAYPPPAGYRAYFGRLYAGD